MEPRKSELEVEVQAQAQAQAQAEVQAEVQDLGWGHESRHERALGRNQGLGQDSWVDAVVTLLATIVFGLGWVLVELERAEPPANRYDAAVSTAWVAAVAASIDARAAAVRPTEMASMRSVALREDGDAGWTERMLQRSNR